MQIITEGTFFSLLLFLKKTYTWIILVWHQLPAPLRGFQLPNNKQIRGQRTMYFSVLLYIQLGGCTRLQSKASPGCSANSDVKVETRCEGLGGPKNTNFVAHQKWIIFSVLSLLVSIPSWKAASSPNSSWGQNGASFLRYYKPVWAQKRIQCSRPNSFKANNPPESCESATTVNVNLHHARWERNFNNDIIEERAQGSRSREKCVGPSDLWNLQGFIWTNMSPCSHCSFRLLWLRI